LKKQLNGHAKKLIATPKKLPNNPKIVSVRLQKAPVKATSVKNVLLLLQI